MVIRGRIPQVEAHLAAKHAEGAGAGAVGTLSVGGDGVLVFLEDVAQKIFVRVGMGASLMMNLRGSPCGMARRGSCRAVYPLEARERARGEYESAFAVRKLKRRANQGRAYPLTETIRGFSPSVTCGTRASPGSR